MMLFLYNVMEKCSVGEMYEFIIIFCLCHHNGGKLRHAVVARGPVYVLRLLLTRKLIRSLVNFCIRTWLHFAVTYAGCGVRGADD